MLYDRHRPDWPELQPWVRLLGGALRYSHYKCCWIVAIRNGNTIFTVDLAPGLSVDEARAALAQAVGRGELAHG